MSAARKTRRFGRPARHAGDRSAHWRCRSSGRRSSFLRTPRRCLRLVVADHPLGLCRVAARFWQASAWSRGVIATVMLLPAQLAALCTAFRRSSTPRRAVAGPNVENAVRRLGADRVGKRHVALLVVKGFSNAEISGLSQDQRVDHEKPGSARSSANPGCRTGSSSCRWWSRTCSTRSGPERPASFLWSWTAPL